MTADNAAPTPARDDLRERLTALAAAEDVDAEQLIGAAVEAVAWSLIDQTMDTADRAPSDATIREAMDTARRALLADAPEPDTRGEAGQRADHYQYLYEQASEGKCGYSGLTLGACKASICDCFEFPWVKPAPEEHPDPAPAVAEGTDVEAVHGDVAAIPNGFRLFHGCLLATAKCRCS